MGRLREAASEYGLELTSLDSLADGYDAAILAVNHQQFEGLGARLRDLVGESGVVYDVKASLPREVVTARL